MTLKARRVLRIDFTAADLARTKAFYEALGFVAAAEPAPVDGAELALLGVAGSRAERLTLRLGREDISFLRFDPPGRASPAARSSTDLWFQHIAVVVSDMADARARVIDAGGQPITRGDPQRLPPETGGVTAFKFRDPDAHPLELLSFPDGTGAAAWRGRASASPFLGIDHTALAVGDPDRATDFFVGLGLVVGPETLNHGLAQERLDDVSEARCRVVPLMPAEAPPHVELLGYTVGPRRPMPPDTRADDIWATRVWLEVACLPDDAQAAAVRLPGGARAVLLHDPDGHAIVLTVPSEPA